MTDRLYFELEISHTYGTMGLMEYGCTINISCLWHCHQPDLSGLKMSQRDKIFVEKEN